MEEELVFFLGLKKIALFWARVGRNDSRAEERSPALRSSSFADVRRAKIARSVAVKALIRLDASIIGTRRRR